jgi:SAM-dependent methyltransferase
MSAKERLHNEQVFHDQQACARRTYLGLHPEELRFDEEWYLDHETWIRHAFDQLGDVRGHSVLDCGCGHGMASILLARRGAKVTALDLSAGYLEEARTRAEFNGVGANIRFVQASAERLPFPPATFDCLWGNAVLHHLDLSRAARELVRVLKPGGKALFCEPWGENPVLEWARRRLPYPGKQRSADERPLRKSDLFPLQRHFTVVHLQPFQLLGMTRRLWPRAPFHATLERWDAALFRRWPGLRRLCRYVVLSLRS